MAVYCRKCCKIKIKIATVKLAAFLLYHRHFVENCIRFIIQDFAATAKGKRTVHTVPNILPISVSLSNRNVNFMHKCFVIYCSCKRILPFWVLSF